MNIEMNDIALSIRKEMEKFDTSIDVAEVGEVIMVGDGIARVSGLENVMSSELIELPKNVTVLPIQDIVFLTSFLSSNIFPQICKRLHLKTLHSGSVLQRSRCRGKLYQPLHHLKQYL